MPETAPVAVQTSDSPTNKLAAGVTVAGGLGAVIAGALASYGSEAIRDVLTEVLPVLATKPAATNMIVFLGVTVAAFFANRQAGLAAGFNVLDAPNRPLQIASTTPTKEPTE